MVELSTVCGDGVVVGIVGAIKPVADVDADEREVNSNQVAKDEDVGKDEDIGNDDRLDADVLIVNDDLVEQIRLIIYYRFSMPMATQG